MKKTLNRLSMLIRPSMGESVYLYLDVVEEAVSVVLIIEFYTHHKSLLSISHSWEKMDVKCIKLQTNFELVVYQIKEDTQAKGHLLQKYLKLVMRKLAEFKKFEMYHMPQEETHDLTSNTD